MVMMEKPLMEKPSPIQVGREFVRQYYTLLNHAPELLYRFYSVNSTYVHGGKYCNGEPAEPVIGQKEINCKIGSLKFIDCHTKIKQVDAHSTIGNGVVVQVTGELSNAGNPLRRFMQTFVLAPQGDNPFKFYVHNDIFRYQDEVFMDDTPSEHSENEPEIEDEVIQPPSPTPEQTYTDNFYPASAAPPTSHTPEQTTSPHPLTNGIDRLTEASPSVDTSSATPVPEPELPVEPEPSPVPEEPQEVIPDTPPSPEPPAEETPPPPVEEPEPLQEELNLDEVPDVKPVSSKPFSWADMASKNTPAARTSFPPATTPKVQPQTFTPPEPAAEPVEPPQPPRQQTRREPPRNNFNNDRGDGGPDMRHNRRPGGPGQNGPIRYPDNQQVFVGNLPFEINDTELRSHFSQFGKVIEVRINHSHTSNPSFGFVIFEDPKSVEEVLHEMPITFKTDRGDHRINIEEKKQRSRDNNRSRGGGMGGDQRRMGGGDMRGGRRGGPPMMRRDRQGSRDGQRQGGNYMGGPRR